jgi:signal transduction histidine kinase
VWINGNPTLLRVAVANLAQNALKYSESEVNISLSVSKTNVELVFADHGIGIPPHDLPNILKPLYRASNTAQVVGTGLGLTMVNRVAELHQAKLYIASDAGQGTTASLVFSLAEPL